MELIFLVYILGHPNHRSADCSLAATEDLCLAAARLSGMFLRKSVPGSQQELNSIPLATMTDCWLMWAQPPCTKRRTVVRPELSIGEVARCKLG